MSGDTAAAAESGGREQTPEQSLEAGLLPSGLQVPARGRCWRSGLGFWVWDSGSGRDPERNGKHPGCGGRRDYPGLSW